MDARYEIRDTIISVPLVVHIIGPQPTAPKITEGILSPEAELNPILRTKQVASATSTTKSKSCR